MVIKVKAVSRSADTNAQGDLLFSAVQGALSKGKIVTIDFDGISNVTSSFVNSSFVRLLDFYDFPTIKSKVRIIGANRQIAEVIKSRMYFEAA